MKKCFMAVCCMALAACMNTDTTNIIVVNEDKNDKQDKLVQVSLEEIFLKLQVDTLETFLLLNEKNLPVEYSLTPDKKFVSFVISVKGKSQKTYSIHKKRPSLSDNFMKFRSSNIYLTLK